MKTFAVLATGPSMSAAVADEARQYDGRICVNDAFRLAPDADGMCANDGAWWRANPDALKFAGRKFSCNYHAGVEQVSSRPPVIERASNSALLALHVAITKFGAERVILFGVDLSAERGQHYFGPHTHQLLKNTAPRRFKVMIHQFELYAKTLKDVTVFNASQISALKCFPFLV